MESQSPSIRSLDTNINVRPAECIDVVEASVWQSDDLKNLFGSYDLIDMYERSMIAVAVEEESSDQTELIAVAIFNDYPFNDPADSVAWEPWIQEHFNLPFSAKSLNCTFMNAFLTKTRLNPLEIHVLFRAPFYLVYPLEHILVLCPNDSTPVTTLSSLMNQMEYFFSETDEGKQFMLISLHRTSFFPEVKIRDVRPEDHDDLVSISDPIFNDTLTNLYGDYVLSELSINLEPGTKFLAAEVKGKAVGMMLISRDVDLQLLNENFDLIPYNGFRKLEKQDSRSALVPIQDIDDPDQESRKNSLDILDTVLVTGSRTENAPEDLSVRKFLNRRSTLTRRDEAAKVDRRRSVARNLLPPSGSSGGPRGSIAPSRRKSMTLQVHDVKSIHRTSTVDIMKMKPRRKPPSLPKLSVFQERLFEGTPNVFCIQLYSIDPMYADRSIELLTYAFDFYSDLDYCIIAMPGNMDKRPLLQFFSRLPCFPYSSFPHELYIMHRGYLSRNIEVRRIQDEDQEEIWKICQKLHGSKYMLKDIDRCMPHDTATVFYPDDNTIRPIQYGYIMLCGDQIVGVAVIRWEGERMYLRTNYDLENKFMYDYHHAFEHGRLLHFLLSPSHKIFTKFFMREILRLSYMTQMYFFLRDNFTKDWNGSQTLISCLDDMNFIPYRRPIHYNPAKLKANNPHYNVTKTFPLFTLFHSNKKLLYDTISEINDRIVVIGVNDLSLGFLERLITNNVCKFTNIVLVTRHGIPGMLEKDPALEIMYPCTFHFSRDKLYTKSFQTFTSMVFGDLEMILCDDKCIKLKNQTALQYDHLFLFGGMEYVLHEPGKPSPTTDQGKPVNVFTLNTELEASQALFYVETLLLAGEEDIVVYGNSLEAFSCLESLIVIGLNPSRIIYIHPGKFRDTNQYLGFRERMTNESRKIVQDSLRELGVKHYEEYDFVGWDTRESQDLDFCDSLNDSPNTSRIDLTHFMDLVEGDNPKPMGHKSSLADGNLTSLGRLGSMRRVSADAKKPSMQFRRSSITNKQSDASLTIGLVANVLSKSSEMDNRRIRRATFSSRGKNLVLSCGALFFLHYKSVRESRRQAYIDASLVFEDCLIVNHRYETNQPDVYAAGYHTKYARRYKATMWESMYYSQREVGLSVANIFLTKWGLRDENIDNTVDHSPDSVIVLSKPVITKARLPGGWYYLHVDSPGADPFHLDKELITGELGSDVSPYFRLGLDVNKRVRKIVCIKKEPIVEDENLAALYGLNEQSLNNLLTRYNDGLIKCLMDYFSEPWAVILAHDKFPRMKKDIRDYVFPKQEMTPETQALFDKIITLVETTNVDTHDRQELINAISSDFAAAQLPRKVEEKVIEFIELYSYQLPMYAKLSSYPI